MTADAKALAARETEALTPVEAAVMKVTVHDAATYERADRLLTEAARHKADLVGKRKDITSGAYQTIKKVEALFRPPIKILERCEAHLKEQIGAYRVQLESAEREARAAALEAAQSGEHGAMSAALEAASDLGARPPGRSSARFEWRIKRVEKDMLPAEYLAPDWERIREAAANAGEDPPVIPGVIFERHARISARK